jgi:hypothetical protein
MRSGVLLSALLPRTRSGDKLVRLALDDGRLVTLTLVVPTMTQMSDSDLTLSASDRAALGTFRSVYMAGSRMHKVNITIAAVFTLLLAVPAIALLIGALVTSRNGMIIAAAILGALALLPGITLWYRIRKLDWKLYLFDNGFVFASGAARVILWNDVRFFYERQSVVAGMQADQWLRFVLSDGQSLTIDSSYKEFPVFAEVVRQCVTKTVLARASAALSNGQAVAFGKLLLSPAGLEKDGNSIPWGDVHSICMEERVFGSRFRAIGVVIYRRSTTSKTGRTEWHVRAIPEFPNVVAFLQLVSRFSTISGLPNT